jgi:hypothetical protein
MSFLLITRLFDCQETTLSILSLEDLKYLEVNIFWTSVWDPTRLPQNDDLMQGLLMEKPS